MTFCHTITYWHKNCTKENKNLKMIYFIISGIIIPICVFLYKKNNEYYKITKNFSDKLPAKSKQHKKLTDDQIKNNPYLPPTAKTGISVIDVSNHQTSISQNDIDQFFHKIEDFDYKWIIFKKYYGKFSNNLKRFENAVNVSKNLNLIMIQEIISEPLSFYDVFKIHISKIWWTRCFFNKSNIFEKYSMNFNCKI